MMQLPRYAAVDTPDALMQEAVTLAGEAADAAAQISLSYFRQPMDVRNKAGEGLFDPVTQADKKVEQLIREHVARRFPAHGFFGEEGENSPQKQQTNRWHACVYHRYASVGHINRLV